MAGEKLTEKQRKEQEKVIKRLSKAGIKVSRGRKKKPIDGEYSDIREAEIIKINL